MSINKKARKIYVVDDQKFEMVAILSFLRRIPKSMASGFENLDRLYAAILEDQPTAIVCDETLQAGRRGSEVLTFLEEKGLDIPVVIVSSSEDVVRNLQSVGIEACVKPVDKIEQNMFISFVQSVIKEAEDRIHRTAMDQKIDKLTVSVETLTENVEKLQKDLDIPLFQRLDNLIKNEKFGTVWEKSKGVIAFIFRKTFVVIAILAALAWAGIQEVMK